jgi:predicted PurR-regulated permease PerM
MKLYDRWPLYVKLGFQFLVIFFICYFIYVSQSILIPFAFAVLLAMLLLPVVIFLESKKIGRILSIIIALLCATGFVAIIIYLLSNQISIFVNDVPSIKQHLNEHFIAVQNWIKNRLHISVSEQNQYLAQQADKLRATGTGYIRSTFFSISEALMLLILMPIYSFLLLYYRIHIRNFLFAIFKKELKEDVQNVIIKSRLMIRNYMIGIVIEMSVVAFSNSIGLLILGIKYAIFFGVLSAVLNIIPYLGMFTATLFTVVVTLTTSANTSDVIWIVVIFYGIHMLDVNILMPNIVSSRLRINVLISVLGVVIGGALTGISGLFLSVPAIAFIKILCDQIDSLKPWGMLMGADTADAQQNRIYKKLQQLSKLRSPRRKRLIQK